jgi:hypothetical protein
LTIKLVRSVTPQIEAPAKWRPGGEQVVRVMHAHAGGQAIVGSVQAAAGTAARRGEVATWIRLAPKPSATATDAQRGASHWLAGANQLQS